MIQPTLTLNFARTGQLGRRVNFSRSSTGVYTGYDGILKYASINEPRFDYDASGNSLGLLIEEQRTNLVTYGQDFDNAVWVKVESTITANAAAAPDSTLTADKLTPMAILGSPRMSVATTLATDGTDIATFSIYLKSGGYTKSRILLGQSATQSIYVDLESGELFSVGADVIASGVSAAGDGWWRVSVHTDMTVTTGTQSVIINVLNADWSGQFTGDGTSGIYLWGAQLELGTAPSSYTPTAAATATRTADAAELSGDPFNSWINTEGTLLAKYKNAGWLYNDTPPTDSLDLTKYIDDYSTSAAGDTLERVIFYPRTLTAAQRGRIML